jgi:signal peptidase I
METKRRKPWLAALLSLLEPGLGQIYNGQLKKGSVIAVGFYLIGLLIAIVKFEHTFYGLVISIGLALGAIVAIALDAFISAKKRQDYILKPLNKLYFYILVVIISFALSMVIDGVPMTDYNGIDRIKREKMASGSMRPTIRIGERVIVDLNYYKNSKPQTGDLVIFEYPEDLSKEFIKRVVALPGDTIELKDKKLYINDKLIEEPYIQYTDKSVRVAQLEPRDKFGPYRVPEDKYFMMGDNRDLSYDSRWWGPVDKKLIKGKALYIYWSTELERFGAELK